MNEYAILEQFYQDCLNFWNGDKEKALRDVQNITTNPFIPHNSPMLDKEIKALFIQEKQKMDPRD